MKEIIMETVSKLYSILWDIAEEKGVPHPDIRWVKNILVPERKKYGCRGVYGWETQEILLAYKPFEIITETPGFTNKDIKWQIAETVFHEMKHYLQDTVEGVELEEYRGNIEELEDEADKYARRMTEKWQNRYL